ncbi:MAG: prepilin-type N-terminal cleavage/methylation domain-containing protein, partial [Tenericutes bacterium]|nr:prepilin-type N-terminal cleavage/methylation domain-containing protein [Mycoplasmatota bacterium]
AIKRKEDYMKEKGFTLIELLAVIVILSVITLITIPMITNVIEESKKKALASSIQGLVESANLYAIENDGVYEFLFDKEHKGSTKKGESLDYRGNIDGEGKLYLDKEGNVSVCISNDTYYAYKNYNSGIIVGERKAGNCIIGFDALTNKYVAMLDNGTGNVSNVYSKDEVDNLVNNLNTEIANMKSNIEELQNNLNTLSSVVSSNTENINSLSNELNGKIVQVSATSPSGAGQAIQIQNPDKDKYVCISIMMQNSPSGMWYLLAQTSEGMSISNYNENGNVTIYFSVNTPSAWYSQGVKATFLKVK